MATTKAPPKVHDLADLIQLTVNQARHDVTNTYQPSYFSGFPEWADEPDAEGRKVQTDKTGWKHPPRYYLERSVSGSSFYRHPAGSAIHITEEVYEAIVSDWPQNEYGQLTRYHHLMKILKDLGAKDVGTELNAKLAAALALKKQRAQLAHLQRLVELMDDQVVSLGKASEGINNVTTLTIPIIGAYQIALSELQDRVKAAA